MRQKGDVLTVTPPVDSPQNLSPWGLDASVHRSLRLSRLGSDRLASPILPATVETLVSLCLLLDIVR